MLPVQLPACILFVLIIVVMADVVYAAETYTMLQLPL